MSIKKSFLEGLVPAVAENLRRSGVKGSVDLQHDLIVIKAEIKSSPLTAGAWSMLKIKDEELLDVMRRAALTVGLTVKE